MVGPVVWSSAAASAVETTSDIVEKIMRVAFSLTTALEFPHWKEKAEELSSVEPLPAQGPLLAGIVRSQREAETIVGNHETLSVAATAVVEYLRNLRSPLVWPVGEAADRLVGAASLVAAGTLRQRGWTDDLRGERVVVLAVADATSLALQQAARHARQLGAVEVHGCRIGLSQAECAADDGFDAFVALTVAAPAEIVIRRV